ncbi:hypothetical protein IQ235_03675 [Oscillatoriales cyanobacterium LEGE 11467]|uniref:Uncharacterized protein n=1 Tax=Zarconia navalis LEGE 11467 TaxID=1828826 RepID=A0A928VY36_9CYAN|nr:hypothetical protein [Zarconia navalis]MBE9039890.1 hypothetical protein [Zarconia navalis LEGE 11467]
MKTNFNSNIRPYQKPAMKRMGRLSEVTLIPSALAGTCAIGTYDPETGLCK